MAIVRWDPFRELAALQERLNRLFGDEPSQRTADDVMARGDWMPAVDIFQNQNHEVVLKAELPGVKREDLDLRVENNTLTIHGTRHREKDVKQENYHRVERAYGSFSRSFSLPNTIDSEKVRAECKDGILSVVLPLKEESKPKQIQVHIKD